MLQHLVDSGKLQENTRNTIQKIIFVNVLPGRLQFDSYREIGESEWQAE
jgi:hypothetical protein